MSDYGATKVMRLRATRDEFRARAATAPEARALLNMAAESIDEYLSVRCGKCSHPREYHRNGHNACCMWDNGQGCFCGRPYYP